MIRLFRSIPAPGHQVQCKEVSNQNLKPVIWLIKHYVTSRSSVQFLYPVKYKTKDNYSSNKSSNEFLSLTFNQVRLRLKAWG